MNVIKTFPDLIGSTGIFNDGDWVESKDQDPNGDIRLIQLADIGVGEFINKSSRYMNENKANELNCTYLQPGDILIARMPDPIGRACIFPDMGQKCVTVVDICVVRVDPNIVNRNWLIHYINSSNLYRQIHNWITGTTRQRISRGNLSKVKIPLPPLEEQKRIAAILDKADALRRKRQQAIDLTEQLLRSVFLDMFGDPVTNPNGWDEVPIAKLCSVPLQNGAYYPKESYTDDSVAGTGMIHMSDAFYGTAKVETAKRVEISEKDIKKYGLQKTDLLVARRSLTLEGSAKPCRIPNLLEPVIYESSLIRIRPDLSKILPEYLFYFLSDIRARQKYLIKYITSSTISGINQSNLGKVLVLVPDINKQERFIEFLKKCKTRVEHQKESEICIDSLLASVEKCAFRGELTKQTKAA